MTDPGYGFVPLPPSVHREARKEARWDRRVPGTLSGCLDIALATEQPVHVGSGGKDAGPSGVIARGARVRGRPGIPGSSFKGALRARYEAITHSCVALAPKPGNHKIRPRSTGLTRARLLASAAVPETSCTPKRACPACALFGCMSLRSRITVTDFACTGDAAFEIALIPERFAPNLHHIGPARIDPSGTVFEVHGLHGRKFGLGRGPATESRQKVEAIPAGSVLTGQIRLFNVTPAELGGLLAALGCDPASALKLGGGKAHGFGRVRCRAACHLVACGEASLDPSTWRRQFTDSPDRWSDGEIRLLAWHRGDC